MSNSQDTQAKVCIVGSGNWGSAIARIIGGNVKKLPNFQDDVHMYVYEEMINGKKLTEIINTEHENVKYLPGYKLPENVIAIPDIKVAAKDADVLIFVVPHQFVPPLCNQMKDVLKESVKGISLIKPLMGEDQLHSLLKVKRGLSHTSVGLELISDIICDKLGIHVSVLMGANLAPEVAAEKFCETTIGCSDESLWDMWKSLFHCNYFKVTCVKDTHTVELCGALKNAVACGAGVIDALGYGDNTKAAIIRLGLIEMKKFTHTFYENVNDDTFFESCGIADLITTCYGGRNRRVSEAYVKTGKSLEELEKELLNGQKLQGPHTAAQINLLLKEKNMEKEFPLFTAVYNIFYQNEAPAHLIQTLQDHF